MDKKIFKYKESGEKLRKIRGVLSKAEFAKELGVAHRTYYRYETGEREMPDGLWRLAEILDKQRRSPDGNVIIHNGNGHVNTGHVNISMNNGSQASLGEGVNLLERIKQAKNKTLYAIAIEQLKGLANMAEKE